MLATLPCTCTNAVDLRRRLQSADRVVPISLVLPLLEGILEVSLLFEYEATEGAVAVLDQPQCKTKTICRFYSTSF
jgi:hypothetical protein